MRGYTTNEKVKTTAGPVAALVIVAWLGIAPARRGRCNRLAAGGPAAADQKWIRSPWVTLRGIASSHVAS
jgi:hypothetical protein